MERKELSKRVDADLLKKYKNRLGSPMMQTALITITQVRQLKQKARLTRVENQRIQSQRKGT